MTSARASAVKEHAAALARCMRFYSRLRVPALPWESDPHAPPDPAGLPRLVPFAGALIGVLGGAVLVLALALGVGPWLASILAIATLTVATGAFHEDGLADTADGFGGGGAPAERLEIMRDSRIGSYGATALILAFALRIAALATLAERLDGLSAAAALVIVSAGSRAAGLIVLCRLPPARREGASYAFGQPSGGAVVAACAMSALIALGLGAAASLPLGGIALVCALAAGAGLAMARLSLRMIGGQTGDVVGATQQVAEIAMLVGLVAAVQA